VKIASVEGRTAHFSTLIAVEEMRDGTAAETAAGTTAGTKRPVAETAVLAAKGLVALSTAIRED